VSHAGGVGTNEPRRPRLFEVLAKQSGPRRCVFDEHMYCVTTEWSSLTFRLQVQAILVLPLRGASVGLAGLRVAARSGRGSL
jgi:hypothetical protein